MDMRTFTPKRIDPDSVRYGPLRTRIVNITESHLGRAVLELENGCQFMLNETNSRGLIRAWGFNSDDWLSLEVEFVLTSYKDCKTNTDKVTVFVRAISLAPNGGTPRNDEVPF